jgi:monoamine oxidase
VPSGEFKGIKVGIIGGGLSGMSAAFELRKLGFDITIFEPITERVGGRVYTYYFDKDKKQYGELGAARFPLSHETTWHYVNLFKLNTKAIIPADPNSFTYVRNVRVRNDPQGENVFHQIYPKFNLNIKEKNTPWPQLYRDVSKYYLSILPPDIRKQFLTIMTSYDPRHEALVDISLRDALLQYGLENEAINLIASVLPIIGGMAYHSFETTLNEEYSLDFLNLYRISGGMVNLPLAFYKSLTSPNPVEYPGILQNTLGKINWLGGYYATGIFKSDKDAQVMISYGNPFDPGKDFIKNFDYVISAVPFSTLRQIDIVPEFSGPKMQAIREIMYEDAYKALFLTSERFWERQGIFGGSSSTDSIIETVLYPPDHQHCVKNPVNCSPYEPGVLTASYTTAQDALRLSSALTETQHHIIARNLEKIHGLPREYLNKIIMDIKTLDWSKEPWFFGAFQMFLPGQKRDFLYASTLPEYDNRVFFAGEHTSSKNGWMQGALQSGMTAANNVAYYSVIHKYQK